MSASPRGPGQSPTDVGQPSFDSIIQAKFANGNGTKSDGYAFVAMTWIFNVFFRSVADSVKADLQPGLTLS